jgi:inhibitor of cysteine peptidase
VISVSRVLVLSLVTCLSFAAQAQCSPKPGSEDIVTVTDKDNGREIGIGTGGTLILRLEAEPGTGYSWQVVQIDRDLLKAQGEPVFEEPEREQPGGTQHQVFRFTAQAPGLAVLKLEYRRTWEKGVAPAKTFSVKLNIHKL